MHEKVAVIGSGAIACGLAAVAAARLGDAVLVARSDDSCVRASRQTGKLLARLEAEGRIDIGTDLEALAGATYVVEAIGADVPARLRELAAEGHLGKKAGRGFFDYEDAVALRKS